MTGANQNGAGAPMTNNSVELAPGERWFVVQTLSKREAKAQFQLGQQGFRVFLPVVMRTVRHARKMRNAKVAAFPGYLFVALDLDRDRWRSVNGTFGVSRLVMSESAPLAVPFGIVEGLARLSRRGRRLPVRPRSGRGSDGSRRERSPGSDAGHTGAARRQWTRPRPARNSRRPGARDH